ncbi:hypothetical protein [Streptomyces sp. NPDC054887]
MTKAQRADSPVPGSIGPRSEVAAPAVRMGKWVFTPPVRGGFAQRVHATLHDDDRCVDLRYSSPLLEVFLTELGRIEAEFVGLLHAAAAEDGRRDRPGGPCHA